MTQSVNIFSLVISALVCSDAARILVVIPTPSISHQVPLRPLTLELAKRGHEVIVVTADPAFPKGQAPSNLTEINFHDVSYSTWKEEVSTSLIGNKEYINRQVKVFYSALNKVIEKQLKSDEFQHIIKNGNFDLLVLEAWARPLLVLSHFFKVPVIQVSSFGRSFGNYETVGAPTHPLLYPIAARQKIYNLTLMEKIIELYKHYVIINAADDAEQDENNMLKRNFGPDIPDISELSKNVDMLFLNSHPLLDGNHPLPPSVIHMWGIHKPTNKKLPKDLQSYLDASENGAVYVSFGTNADPAMWPAEKIQIFVKVFSRLPYDVMWKWNNDELPGRTKNIKISKWFPQSDLLRHPKIKLFITQGGLQSTDEAIAAGVPLIGIPMLGDQWFNVEKYLRHEIGARVDFDNLTEEKLKTTIDTVIGDESYRNNIVKLRSLMRDEAMPPLDRAVWWTEHVLRHGGARHLRAPAANMPWSEYLELELVFTLLSVLLVSVIVTIFVLYKLYYIIKSSLVSSGKLKQR